MLVENDALAHAENQKNRKSHKSEYQKFKLSPALRFSRVDNKLQIRLCCFLFELRSDYVFYSNYAPPAIVVSCESANVKIAREFSPFTADRFSSNLQFRATLERFWKTAPLACAAKVELSTASGKNAENTEKTLVCVRAGLRVGVAEPSRAEGEAAQQQRIGASFLGARTLLRFFSDKGTFLVLLYKR